MKNLMKETKHISVLSNEVLQLLNPKKGEVFVDATLGGGGHTFELLKKVESSGKVIALDYDWQNIERIKKKQIKNLILINENFKNINKVLDKLKVNKVNGFIMDLGFSSDQLETVNGLSFQKNEVLDMRIDKTNKLSAKKVINTFSKEKLIEVFEKYGEERKAKSIANKILNARKKKKIEKTIELKELINSCFSNKRVNRIDPATKVFMALRIFVNKELDNLELFLERFNDYLICGGKIAILSFHSLEDRIVKNYFKEKIKNCICDEEAMFCSCNHKQTYKKLSKKPIVAGKEEIILNPRSRSAKLRVYKKI